METVRSQSASPVEAQSSEIKPEVSVIVPVYNVEPYLRRCIDSLINQTLQNIEIILVDDGSTDGCGAICDEYSAQDARIRVVRQENAGLSGARNAGIDRARADYLMFVDSDDWVEPDFCRIPLTFAKEQQADLVMFQFRDFNDGHERKRHFSSIGEVKITQERALSLMMGEVGITAWNKLYRKGLFHYNRYPIGMVFEDMVLTPVLVHEAQNIAYMPVPLYNREHRSGSITTILSLKHAQDWFNAVMQTVQNLKEWGYIDKAEIFKMASMRGFIAKGWPYPELNEKCIRYLRSLRRLPTSLSYSQRCKHYLCVISPKLYRLVYKVYRFLRP